MIDVVGTSATEEQLDTLADEIATFAARIDVAEHALISRLRVFDAHEAWGPRGFLSCAQWLSWRANIGIKAAREKVRVARALACLPKIDALFGQGQLSYSKVRALTRVATPEREQELIDIALHATASQLERLIHSFARSLELCQQDGTEPEPVPRDQRRWMRRSESAWGMVRIEIQLPAEEAAIVWDAAMAASERASAEASGDADSADEAPAGASGDAERTEEASAEASGNVDDTEEASAGASGDAGSAEQTSAGASGDGKRADEASAGASGDASSAEEASAGASSNADGAEEASAEASACPDPAAEQRRADGLVDMARAYLQHRPRSRGAGYELVVITTAADLEQSGPGVGGFLRDGTPIPRHVAQMLGCDSARVDITLGEQGEVLDVGRSTRTIPPAIGRALALRDGGCRAPGCGHRQHLHAHHIHGWASGGPTSLANLVLVCSGHHRLIHEGSLRVSVHEGEFVFHTASGTTLHNCAESIACGHELEQLERFLEQADVHLDPSMIAPRWDGTRLDLHDALGWMFVAEQTRRPLAASALA